MSEVAADLVEQVGEQRRSEESNEDGPIKELAVLSAIRAAHAREQIVPVRVSVSFCPKHAWQLTGHRYTQSPGIWQTRSSRGGRPGCTPRSASWPQARVRTFGTAGSRVAPSPKVRHTRAPTPRKCRPPKGTAGPRTPGSPDACRRGPPRPGRRSSPGRAASAFHPRRLATDDIRGRKESRDTQSTTLVGLLTWEIPRKSLSFVASFVLKYTCLNTSRNSFKSSE